MTNSTSTARKMSIKEKIENLQENFKIPDSKFQRFFLGWGLVLGGIVSFLPVLGVWMLPLGIMVLAVDYPFARRLKRRTEVWWGRKKKSRNNQNEDKLT